MHNFDNVGLVVKIKSGLGKLKKIERMRLLFVGVVRRFEQETPIVYRLLHGGFWALGGTVASRIFSMATTIFIARILGKEDYGAYGMVQSTIGMFGLFAGMAMGATTSKYVAQLKSSDPARSGRIIGLTMMLSIISGGLSMVLIITGAPWLARVTLNRPDLTPILMTGAILLFMMTVGGVQISSLAGFEAFKEIAIINVIQGVATPFISLPLVYIYGIHGAIVSLIIITALGWYFCKIAIKRECDKFNIVYKTFSFSNLSERGILWRFALPALISGALVIPVTWATNAVLVNQINGYSELGLFNAANQWRQFITFIPLILSGVMLPIFSDVHGRQQSHEFVHALNINLGLTWTIALPMTILTIVVRGLISDLFGRQFSGMVPLMAPLMVTSFLNILNNVIGTALMGSGQMWIGAMFNLAWAISLCIITLIMVPKFGGLGLAIAYLIAYALHTVWQMIYVEMKLAPSSILRHWRLILISIFCLGIAPFTSQSYLPSIIPNLFLIAIGFVPLSGLIYRFFSAQRSFTITT